MIDDKYVIHYGRFETHWTAFCEEHHIDRDDEKIREFWEDAYIDGASGVLYKLDVVKLRKPDKELSDEFKEDILNMTNAELATYLYVGTTRHLPEDELSYAKAVVLLRFINDNATNIEENPKLFSLLLSEDFFR